MNCTMYVWCLNSFVTKTSVCIDEGGGYDVRTQENSGSRTPEEGALILR